MNLAEVVDTSRLVTETSARRRKVERLASLLERSGPEETPIVVAYLSGELPQGRIGVGPALLREAVPDYAAPEPVLSVGDVDAVLQEVAAISGPGSVTERGSRLRQLMTRATRPEQRFLGRLLLGELRQGALEGIMAEALAEAAGVSAAAVRRAVMLSGDLGVVARIAIHEGPDALAGISLRLFRPVQPMLAQTADGVDEALDRLDEAALEYKLDGVRVQVHRSGEEIRVYTRRLNDVTAAVPELVQRVRDLPVSEVVLDGEALALRGDGRPHPFQITMRRFGRKQDVDRLCRDLPLTALFFDCLYLDGEPLIDRSTEERIDVLDGTVPAAMAIPRTVTDSAEEAARFLDSALEAGHEGIMAKALGEPYEAGRRGWSWLKVKPAHSLDLVVLAAEWGSGRRRGWLSNLHLGARDPEGGGFLMLGKTFKGLSDGLLEWQTQRLQELEIARDDYTVYVRPELVVEIAFDGVQESPQYPGGLALRFARVKRYRPDKNSQEADTVEAVRRIHERT